jgi:hypothetical protein
MTLFQVMSLKTLLLPCHGSMLFLMVGPWSGIRPRPTQVPPSDVEHGLSSNIRCATSVESHLFFAADTITLEKSCINLNYLGFYTMVVYHVI